MLFILALILTVWAGCVADLEIDWEKKTCTIGNKTKIRTVDCNEDPEYYTIIEVIVNNKNDWMRQYECRCKSTEGTYPYDKWILSETFTPGKTVTCYKGGGLIIYEDPRPAQKERLSKIIILSIIFAPCAIALLCVLGLPLWGSITIILIIVACLPCLVCTAIISLVILIWQGIFEGKKPRIKPKKREKRKRVKIRPPAANQADETDTNKRTSLDMDSAYQYDEESDREEGSYYSDIDFKESIADE